MLALLLSVLGSIAAVLGGLLALSERRRLNLTLAFTAGALIGLVAFDLLPEIFEISSTQALDIVWPMIGLATGFLAFHAVERFILIHHSHEQEYVIHRHPHVGLASAFALIGHSFLDGMAIGLAFQVSTSVGIAVGVKDIGGVMGDAPKGNGLSRS